MSGVKERLYSHRDKMWAWRMEYGKSNKELHAEETSLKLSLGGQVWEELKMTDGWTWRPGRLWCFFKELKGS